AQRLRIRDTGRVSRETRPFYLGFRSCRLHLFEAATKHSRKKEFAFSKKGVASEFGARIVDWWNWSGYERGFRFAYKLGFPGITRHAHAPGRRTLCRSRLGREGWPNLPGTAFQGRSCLRGQLHLVVL